MSMLAVILALPTLTLGAVVPPSPAERAGAAGAQVRAIGAEYLQALAEDSLSLRFRLGLPIDGLPEVTLAHAEAQAQRAASLLARLEAIASADLAAEDALSRAMLKRKLRADAGSARFYWLSFPVTPYSSPLADVHSTFRVLPLMTKADADGYLALVARYPALVTQVRTKLEGQVAHGIRLPKDEIVIAATFLEGSVDEGPQSPFFVGEARLASLPRTEAAAFQQGLAQRRKEANQALRGLVAYLTGELTAKAPETVGLSQYPGGREYYDELVKRHTTLDVTPEEVHRIGLEEVARIEARMAEVQTKVGFTGTAPAFRESLRTDPRFVPTTPDEIGKRLLSHVHALEPKVDAYFLRTPKAPYGVKRLEPEREAAMTFGTYEPPSPTEPRGLYYYNGSKLEDRSLLTAAPIAYHELVPGHHFQIALADENKALPRFRREIMDTAYTEGWADYSAGLADEMGLYADPYDLYGRLAMDMFISVRLVVDTGMNALGWSRARAVAFMREHDLESDTQIHTESLRYAVDMPGQALAYKMGSRGFWELRRKAEKALGPRFDVRRFHECILGGGSLPLAVLEQEVDACIARERSQ